MRLASSASVHCGPETDEHALPRREEKEEKYNYNYDHDIAMKGREEHFSEPDKKSKTDRGVIFHRPSAWRIKGKSLSQGGSNQMSKNMQAKPGLKVEGMSLQFLAAGGRRLPLSFPYTLPPQGPRRDDLAGPIGRPASSTDGCSTVLQGQIRFGTAARCRFAVRAISFRQELPGSERTEQLAL